MNPNLCRLVLRPRDPLACFDVGIRLMREHWSLYAKLTALLVLPGFLLSVPLLWLTGGSWWVSLPFLFLSCGIQAPFSLLTGRLLFADSLTFRGVLAELRSMLGPLFAGLVIEIVTLLTAGISCGLSLFLTLCGFSFLNEALVLERLGSTAAMGRATRLAAAHPVNALCVGVARIGLSVWMMAVCELGGGQLTSFVLQLGYPMGSVSNGQLTPWVVLGFGLAQPLFATYRMMLYVDTRTRVEGWDLQVGLRAVGLSA